MGRSKGDPARSKARASSSSLAASLLQTPVTSAVGFGGFVGSSRVDVPTPTDGEHLQDVDGDAFLHLKRLSKKDPTTKLKALVALRALFEERPATEVSALISPWLFEYKRLVQDSSRQVRQATHVAMTSFANCVGRGLAPHLRSLMGPWWISQFDPSREVSEAAKDSFQVAFSGQKKRLEALMFCEKEIFNYLDENLKLTPQTISDKATPIEESTEKYERVVSCSLLASAALIDVLIGSISGRTEGNATNSVDGEEMSDRRERISEDVRKLCGNHRFLQQFLKSKASRVRSATYQALRSYIQHLPEVLREEDMDIVVPSILGTLAEKDPACHQHMWDMVLLFTKAFPQSWGTSAVRKAVFPQLWSFLRHGCYGSPQTSYPYVVLLISLIPPSAVIPSQNFLLNLFSNLWLGQTAPQFGLADLTALLKAVQKCLVWSVLKAKRFSDAEGYEAVQLQTALIDGVLVKLLWLGYIGGYLNQDTSLVSSVIDSSPSAGLSGPTSVNKASGVNIGEASSDRFKQELGSCIVQTIQLLSGHVDEVMDTFWNEFQGSCFQIILEAGNCWQSKKEEDPRIARIADFFLVLCSKTSKGEDREQWSLTHTVRPFVAKSFPAIRSLGHPGSIRLIAKLTSMYGPSVFSLLNESQVQNEKTDEGRQYPVGNEGLQEFFQNDIVPWCLAGDDDLNGPKAELILAFIEDVKFRSEWEFVISHVTGWQEDTDSTVDLRQVEVLATLLEKLMESKNALSTSKDYLLKGSDRRADCWKSSRIDRAAVKVASSSHLFHPGCLRLLRSALGGTSSEQPFSPIVSDEAAVEILNIILLKMLGVLSAQDKKWTRSAPSLILDLGASDLDKVSEDEEITDKILQLAVSAVNVLGDCIFSLLPLDRDHTISGKLVAAMFCLKWAYSSPDDSAFYNGYDSSKDSDTDLEDSEEEIGFDVSSTFESSNLAPEMEDSNVSSETLEFEPSMKLEQDWSGLRESLLSIWQKATPQFFSRFSALTRFGLRQVLMKCIRVAVLDEDSDKPQHVARKCAGWAQEVVNYVCSSPDEVSEFEDLLLASADSWPLWVVAPSPKSNQSGRYLPSWNVQDNVSDLKIQRHGRFAAFVDHLSRTLTSQEMFLGSQQGTERNEEDNLLEKLARESKLSGESCRTWVVVELLCTWEWSGGNALSQVLPYLWSIARSPEGSSEFSLLWGTIYGLFVGSSNSSGSNLNTSISSSAVAEDDGARTKEPFLRALLVLLQGLLEKEDGWSIFDARALFRLYVSKQAAADFVSPICDVQILPRVLAVLMPILRKKGIESADTSSEEEWQTFLQTAVSLWVQKAFTGPPLVAFESGSENLGHQWVKIAVACFPLNPAGGVAAMASANSVSVTSQERDLLLALLRKQYSYEAIRAVGALAAAERISQVKLSDKMEQNKGVEVTLAKLVAVALGYCWLNFETEEWNFILKKVRGWLQEAVIKAEEFTEAVVDTAKKAPEMPELEVAGSVILALENVVAEKRDGSVQLYSVAVAIFSLLWGLSNLENADSTDAMAKLRVANWETVEMRILEDVLRLLLSIGLAESGAAASNAGENGAKLIASQRQLQSQLWDSVADVALGASNHARQASIRAVDLWGVGKGAISSLYALLFSPKPSTSLQWVAYEFLSTPEILPLAISFGIVIGSGETQAKIEEGSTVEGEVQNGEVQDAGEVKVGIVKGDDTQGMLPAQIAQIRPELARTLEISPSVILHSPLTSPLRVSYLLGWSLLLTRLQSLTALSRARELLVQYVQDSDISPTLLDCLFQYIPQEQKLGTSGPRRRNRTAKVTTSSAAASATRAAATGSVAFAVEGVWPVQKESLVTLAGAVYGLMLLVLPACVRIWFTGLRDKSLASAIDAFTTTHCSPQLLADEFAQVQASAVNEENLSIRSNRTLREVTAIYQKEEAGMDIVIRIPSCYPLRAVEVECTRRLGINETLLRKWILSMAAFLRNQNGAVAEAVQMWKKNVDREFEGVEECPICYSIIHTSNHSLPRLACKTCRHKFHSACLYKWFSTSHQSTCPLCKSPF